ncbi:MAG: HAMP domain-containing sensor histidine kinase [Acidimicrobiia bacterium]|nr:HAMP domain-containing sensor histidine kinase [Acidimicrobiia bacterium]
MSFRVRIALISATAVAVAFAVAAWITYGTAQRELIAEVDISLQERIEQIEQSTNPIELIAVLGAFDERLPRGPFERGVRGFDAIFWQFVPSGGAGTAITDFPGEGGLPFGPAEQAVLEGEAVIAVRTVNVGDDNLRLMTSALPAGAMQVARSLAEVDSSLEGLESVLRLAAFVGVLLAAVIGYLIARGVARPISQLAAAAEHVAATQELEARIKVERTDEVGRLAESFNSMLAALESSRQQQRRLVHDASHELRTPLTALRTNIELLAKVDDLPEEERRQMIADLDSEIRELSGLVAELVELAAEPRRDETAMTDVEFGELIEAVVDKHRRRTGRAINVSTDASVVHGQSSELERAVSNLLDNAAKWSPPDSPIDVRMRHGRVTVADQGPGIDEADRPFVFDRFYRATGARSTPGSGLGLSIVAKVAGDHGGSVFVDDSATGAVVGFEIPVADGRDQVSSGS